jgi:hypothetical protein
MITEYEVYEDGESIGYEPNETTIKRNIEIAVLMGYDYNQDDNCLYKWHTNDEGKKVSGDFHFTQHLEYHKTWNWLMPVIQLINGNQMAKIIKKSDGGIEAETILTELATHSIRGDIESMHCWAYAFACWYGKEANEQLN